MPPRLGGVEARELLGVLAADSPGVPGGACPIVRCFLWRGGRGVPCGNLLRCCCDCCFAGAFFCIACMAAGFCRSGADTDLRTENSASVSTSFSLETENPVLTHIDIILYRASKGCKQQGKTYLDRLAFGLLTALLLLLLSVGSCAKEVPWLAPLQAYPNVGGR